MAIDPSFKAAITVELKRIVPLLKNIRDRPEYFAFIPNAKPGDPAMKLSEPMSVLLHSKVSILKAPAMQALAEKQLKLKIQPPARIYCGTVHKGTRGMVFAVELASSKGTVDPVALTKLLRAFGKDTPTIKTAFVVSGEYNVAAEDAAAAQADPVDAAEADEVEEEEAPQHPPRPPASAGELARYTTLSRELRASIAAAPQLAPTDKVTLATDIGEAKRLADAGDVVGATAKLEEAAAWLASRARAGEAARERVATGPSLMAFSKARIIWEAARKRADAELDRLVKSVLEDPEVASDPQLVAIRSKGMKKLEVALAAYGTELLKGLDEVTNATDDVEKQVAMERSRSILKRYRTQLTGDKVLAQVDDNPFVDVAVYATLDKSLAGIEKLLAA